MTELVKTLINDHRTILTLLKKIRSKNLLFEERKAYLITVKSLLTHHFELEDEKLYPELNKLSTADNGASKTVQEFTVGLGTIGGIIQSFFDHSDESLDNIHNSSDYTKIMKLLEVRIIKEEKGLYPLYDKLAE